MVEAIENGADSIERWESVETTATAIRIGNPVNAPKALPGIRETGGTAVDDEAILDSESYDVTAERDDGRSGLFGLLR